MEKFEKVMLKDNGCVLELHNEDCLKMLRKIENNSVDLIITSPPYNLGHSSRGDNADCLIKYNTYEDNLSYSDYIEWQVEVLKECYRVLKISGVMYYNHKERHINGYYFNPLEIIGKTDFKMLQTIIWDRKQSVSYNQRRYANSYESIYVCYKNVKRYMRIDKESQKNLDVWKIRPPKKALQPATFPLELPLKILEGYKEKGKLVVLDPFSGSCTTALACLETGNDFKGAEVDETYFNKGIKRLVKNSSEDVSISYIYEEQ